MTESHPLVSIILPVYKEPKAYFTDSYLSIINQTCNSIEIIVIIDNPDHLEAIDYFTEASKFHTNTRLVINKKNIGLIETLNKGLSLANGAYVARMDSDDISMTTRIEEQLKFLKRHSLDLVGGYAELIDPQSNTIGTWKMPLSKRGIRMLTKYHTPALHPTWLCKKSVLNQLKGYRDIKHVEDHDLLARAQLAGFTIGNYPSIVIKYRINPQSVSNLNSHWAYWGRIFVGVHFKSKTLNNISSKDFEKYIKSKINVEVDDPRAKVLRLREELKNLKLINSLKTSLTLMMILPSLLIRLKFKSLIKISFLLDRTICLKSQMH